MFVLDVLRTIHQSTTVRIARDPRLGNDLDKAVVCRRRAIGAIVAILRRNGIKPSFWMAATKRLQVRIFPRFVDPPVAQPQSRNIGRNIRTAYSHRQGYLVSTAKENAMLTTDQARTMILAVKAKAAAIGVPCNIALLEACI
jgi:hypothetical protein